MLRCIVDGPLVQITIEVLIMKLIKFRSVQKSGGRNSTTEGADRGPKSEKILAQFLALFSGFSPVLAHSKSAFASQNELEQIKRKKPETVVVSGFS